MTMPTPTRQQPRPLTRREFDTLPPDSPLELRHGQEWRAAKVLGHTDTRIHVGLLMGDQIVGYLLSWIEIQDSLRLPVDTPAPSLHQRGAATGLPACSHCGSPSRLTCQFPLADGTDQRCGKPVCRMCVRRVVTDRDLCPTHYGLLTQPPGHADESPS
jgi:hypothetical protein